MNPVPLPAQTSGKAWAGAAITLIAFLAARFLSIGEEPAFSDVETALTTVLGAAASFAVGWVTVWLKRNFQKSDDTGTTLRQPVMVGIFAVLLTFLLLGCAGPKEGCGPQCQLAKVEYSYQGALQSVQSAVVSGIIKPGSPVALKIADSIDYAQAALFVARGLVDRGADGSLDAISAAQVAVEGVLKLLMNLGGEGR